MFIGQLLKILFIAFFFYLIISFFRLLIGVGRAVNKRRREEKLAGRGSAGTGGENPRQRGRREIIELDKDQYKVD
jgi:hypothetical protein